MPATVNLATLWMAKLWNLEENLLPTIQVLKLQLCTLIPDGLFYF